MPARNTRRNALGFLLLATIAISCAARQTEESAAPAEEVIPVIWDDDGSIDGVTALLYLLQHQAFQVKGATISPGIAHPRVFASNLAGFFAQLGVEGIPVAAGQDNPLAGDNAFPDEWRVASDGFWGFDLPEGTEPTDPRTAAELIIDVVKQSERPVTVFVSGPLTNLAEALRTDPTIKERIRTVEVMGGALEVDGNVSLPGAGTLPAEWNIYIDPLAAAEVFASGVDIWLTPLDVTDRIEWGESDAIGWEVSDGAAGLLAAQLLRQTMRDWSSPSVLIWDLVAALNASERRLCQWEDLHIAISVDEGTSEGQTVILPAEAANARVCLDPDPTAFQELARDVLGNSQ